MKREPTQEESKAFESALKRFNFEKVWAYMTLVGWKWSTVSIEPSVPTVEQMIGTVRELFALVITDQQSGDARGGGFRVTRTQYYISIDFSIEWESGQT